MGKVKHETCQQYVIRRLSEGWRIVGQQGYFVSLSPPNDEFVKFIDLRNDVETLRPDGAGHMTELTAFPGSGEANWEDVDEASPDGDSTYVWYSHNVGSEDFYTIPNSALDAGATINKVTLFGLARCEAGSPSLILGLYIGDTDYNSDAISVSETSYTLKSMEWADDPSDSNPWTVAKINAIQSVRLWMMEAADPNILRGTQVYVEVDTPPAVGLENKSASMAAKMIAGKLI